MSGVSQEKQAGFRVSSSSMYVTSAYAKQWYQQDFHPVLQEEGHSSKVRLPNGVHWEPESCWDNIYDAIMDARVLCYVVGQPILLYHLTSACLSCDSLLDCDAALVELLIW